MSKQEERFSGMESLRSGSVLDPETCNKLSLEEKRRLVHDIAQNSKDAPEVLRAFTRSELLKVICCEMGKERKYTGYSKFQMIEHLLKLISRGSNKRSNPDFSATVSPAKVQAQNKKQRNVEVPPSLVNDFDPVSNQEEPAKFRLCDNVACRANLSQEDTFCKRCSCCICHQYDDNKDPSLWLTCGSETVDENDTCGMSCHLECALKHERSGILPKDCSAKLDGSFYCVYCGKINDITRTWKKQLVVAKEARRVDVLCQRLSLCYKILLETDQYKEMHTMVESAVKMLSKEVGPLDQVAKMSRGIVNRLSCGAEVQKLCSSAVEYFDSKFLFFNEDDTGKTEHITCKIQFEELTSSSVMIVLQYDDHLLNGVLGCRLWHRKCDAKEYPEKPSFIVFKPEKRFKITELHPSTAYLCKVCLISGRGILGLWEAKWATPASSCESSDVDLCKCVKDENVVSGLNHSQAESTNSSDIKLASKGNLAKLRLLDGTNRQKSKGSQPPPSTMITPSVSPLTPCKSDRVRKDPNPGFAKRSEESDYEFSVRVVKWLENEGHLDGDFRVKFLTWFSLKATKQERRVVSVFVDTFVDDPSSLAGQLIHTFLDKICCEQKPVSQHGFCTSLRYGV